MTAFFRALGDLLSPELRSVLWRALGLTLLLFIAVLVGVQMLLAVLTEFSWPWADCGAGVGTGLVLLVAFFFLMAPVTAAFAGLFLDEVAARVELRHYPADPPGTPLPACSGPVLRHPFCGASCCWSTSPCCRLSSSASAPSRCCWPMPIC